MTTKPFVIKPEFAGRLRWFLKSPQEGDDDCLCSLCGEQIGVSELDPLWNSHDEDCAECPICEIAIRLFKPRSKEFPHGGELRFHTRCFEQIIESPQ